MATLRNIDPHAYTDQLEVLAGQMSPSRVNAHVYLGLGWKKQREYTTIYLKPQPASVITPNAYPSQKESGARLFVCRLHLESTPSGRLLGRLGTATGTILDALGLTTKYEATSRA